MRLPKSQICLTVLVEIHLACAHFPPPPTTTRASILQAVVKRVLVERRAEIPTINRSPLPINSCDCKHREAWLRDLPELQPETMNSYCAATQSEKFSNLELRALGVPGPLESGLGRRATPLRFSSLGVNRAGDQAIVCVGEFDQVAFYLVSKHGEAWQVTDVALSILY